MASKAWIGLVLLIGVVVLPYRCFASRSFSAGLGYVNTSSDNYGSGLTYGASIIEGTGRIGFGISAYRFSNSIAYQTFVKTGEQTTRFDYEEDFSDFYLTIMATYNLRPGGDETHLMAGLGPQVHFLAATKHFITDRYSVTARDFRLGMGIALRLERRIYAFGSLAFVVTAMWSWAQAGQAFDPLYEYQTPAESFTFPTITAGVAWPL